MAKTNEAKAEKGPTETAAPEVKAPETAVSDEKTAESADPTLAEMAAQEIEELRAIINEQEAKINEQAAKISEQEATIANMMKDVAAMVEAGPAKAPIAIVEYEGKAYKLRSKVVLIDNTGYTAEDLKEKPKLIAKILAVKGQKTLVEVE